jgi:uncharacterized membrane protein
MEEFLSQFHPQLVHTPIALIIVGALFELAGRAMDTEWMRKAAFAMLIVGVLGAYGAVLSGEGASEKAEHAGIPEATVDRHGDLAKIALWLGVAAVLTRAIAGRTGRVKAAVGGLALVLHLAAATTVGFAAHRGGKLVYEYGANVRVNGVPVLKPKPGATNEHGAGGEKSGEKRGDGD